MSRTFALVGAGEPVSTARYILETDDAVLVGSDGRRADVLIGADLLATS